MSENADPRTVMLVADRLCLNFVNTVDSFAKERPKEYLRGYGDLLGWAEHVGLLEAQHATPLLAAAADGPAEAQAALRRAHGLRWALYELFTALAQGVPAPVAALDVLNQTLGAAPARTRLVASAAGYMWVREGDPHALDLVAWEVARSAADLLTSAEAALVRVCEGEGCTWMFCDTSRGRTRRWCSMGWCGNRAKARRHYRRAMGIEN